jgi:hypothetical protein
MCAVAGLVSVDVFFEGDFDPDESIGFDDEDALAVGEFDEVIRLVGDEHGFVDDEDGLVGREACEAEGGVACAVEFFEGLSELVWGHVEPVREGEISLR